MYKSCSRCGRVHDTRINCPIKRQYIKTDEKALRNKYVWAKKSLDVREKANYLCEVCRDQNTFTYNDLEVHHIEKLKERPDLLLDDNNLICLCVTHHKQADSGELDKDYLKRLANKRIEKNNC